MATAIQVDDDLIQGEAEGARLAKECIFEGDKLGYEIRASRLYVVAHESSHARASFDNARPIELGESLGYRIRIYAQVYRELPDRGQGVARPEQPRDHGRPDRTDELSLDGGRIRVVDVEHAASALVHAPHEPGLDRLGEYGQGDSRGERDDHDGCEDISCRRRAYLPVGGSCTGTDSARQQPRDEVAEC